MNKIAYNTLGTLRELEAAGMEWRQAETIAIARREGNLVAKSDLNSAISRVESDITEIRLDMKPKFRLLLSMQFVVILAVVGFAFANAS